jgi:hypothetical protein
MYAGERSYGGFGGESFEGEIRVEKEVKGGKFCDGKELKK